MAATVSAWGKPGAWALDAEENEAELLEQCKEDSPAGDGAEAADFPSLSATAAGKTKKKKPQAISLKEFSGYSAATKPAVSQSKGLTPDELLLLPTGPRAHSAEELDRSKLGGGFRSYGSRDEQPRRQGSGNRDSGREFAPSKADETDDWGAGKKFSSNNSFERKERGERGGFFSDSQSRADDVDNWASNKSFVPSDPRRNERRGGFGLESSNGSANSSNWGRRKEEEGRKTGGAFDSLRERKGGGGGGSDSNRTDSSSWGRKTEDASGGARPKLNLQPRTLPPVAVEEPPKNEIANEIVKPKGSNPFGEARPREEVLKEKGQDWKEIEEKLESVKMKEVVSDDQKTGFWRASRSERAWRRPDQLVDSHTESVGGADSKKNETGNVEEAEERGSQI